MIERNPTVRFDQGTVLKTIGDTHLGRVFKNNVPLHRRGEYERQQYLVLKEHLEKNVVPFDEQPVLESIRCQVGDWFDKSVVANRDVLNSYHILQKYEASNSEPLYIISGNHDDSKSINEPTSWDLLAQFFTDSKRIIFVKDWRVHTCYDGTQILFVGWNIHNSAATALIQAMEAGFDKIRVVVCHLDRVSYGDDSNVIPYDFFLSKGINYVISGHEHKPYHFRENDMSVIGTGSMLPYSHAEDPEGEHYITFRSLEELQEYGIENLGQKHVRVYVEDPNLLPEFDSLSLQVNKSEADTGEGEISEVVIESYNAKAIWDASAQSVELPKDEADKLWTEITDKGSVEE